MAKLIERLTRWLTGPATAAAVESPNPNQSVAAPAILLGETEVQQETLEHTEGSEEPG